jgi:hypothetical protein
MNMAAHQHAESPPSRAKKGRNEAARRKTFENAF